HSTSLWDLDAPATPAQPLNAIGVLPLSGAAGFSPDGRRIVVWEHLRRGSDGFGDPFRGGLGVFDAATFAPRFVNREVSYPPYRAMFSTDGSRIILNHLAGMTERTRVFSATTGELVMGFPANRFFHAMQASPDGRQIAIIESKVAYSPELYLFDGGAESGAVRVAVGDFGEVPLVFFPDGRLVGPGPDFCTVGIYANPSLEPLAILRGIYDVIDVAISADGSYLAAHTRRNTISFYRKTGLDCPESAWGALAFPHVWLLVVLAIAAAFSLRRDAVYASSELTLPVAHFALVLLVIALPRTLHLLVAGCIGEWFITPAPLFVVAAIGLASGARVWRMIALILLAVAFPLDLYCLYLLKHAGLGGRSATLFFDRTYAVPNLGVFMILLAFTALIPVGIFVLSRRPR
ncbi:MAG: putative repeat-containing protein, partial [Phycisphaerales bacterium]|nr:putative repeat-containing protein [Phycisphaerales bacterium]